MNFFYREIELDNGPIPSFEEGWQRRSSKMPRYLNIGAVGEVKPMLQEGSDLPRCALFE